MFGKLLTPFTTATATGVTVRYLTTIITTIIAIVGILGWLTPEQQDALTKQVPELVTAIAGVVAIIIPLYGIVTKSSSDKAANVAKQVDAKISPSEPAVLQNQTGETVAVVRPK